MQRLLCFFHVVEGLNKHDAAIRAGYAERSAKNNAASIIKTLQPYCSTLVSTKAEKIEEQFDVTVERVAGELARIGFYNPKDYIRVVKLRGAERCIGKPINELTDDQARAIQSWSTERVVTDDGVVYDYRYTFYDKRGAASDLGRHLGMFNERLILEQRVTKHHKVDLSGVPDEVLEHWMADLEKHAGKPVLEGQAELVEVSDGE